MSQRSPEELSEIELYIDMACRENKRPIGWNRDCECPMFAMAHMNERSSCTDAGESVGMTEVETWSFIRAFDGRPWPEFDRLVYGEQSPEFRDMGARFRERVLAKEYERG